MHVSDSPVTWLSEREAAQSSTHETSLLQPTYHINIKEIHRPICCSLSLSTLILVTNVFIVEYTAVIAVAILVVTTTIVVLTAIMLCRKKDKHPYKPISQRKDPEDNCTPETMIVEPKQQGKTVQNIPISMYNAIINNIPVFSRNK